jgi:serine/threonine protein phosphatase PrpC
MDLWQKQRRAGRRRQLVTATLSRPGSYPVNEDSAGEARVEAYTLLALADGLGGHAAGQIASRLAVETCLTRFRSHPALEPPAAEELVMSAHRAIRATIDADSSHGPRTTLTVLATDAATAVWAHVGDSRLYHFRGGGIRDRTRDHSVPELLHRAGEIRDDEIAHHADRNRLLQTLGQKLAPKLTVSAPVALQAGDAFLLCSDGWWEHVPETSMALTLGDAAAPHDWLIGMASLIEAAAHVPQDNYTAIAAFVV